MLLKEIEHRVANSLQIIASIIMLKAKSVESEETRRHLHDAHKRVMSVAAVQHHLHASAGIGSMEMLPYLSTLCGALAQSMIGENQSISLKVLGNGGSSTCANAESIGLIVTELVLNALKHAFNEKTKDGKITVAYEALGTDGSFRWPTTELANLMAFLPNRKPAWERASSRRLQSNSTPRSSL